MIVFVLLAGYLPFPTNPSLAILLFHLLPSSPSSPADVWSVGVIVFVLLAGYLPFLANPSLAILLFHLLPSSPSSSQADVWSVGVIVFVLLAGYLPFEENTMVQLFLKIKAADFEYPSWFTPEVKVSATLIPSPTH